MISSDTIRRYLLPLEIWVSQRTCWLSKIPVLHHLHQSVTARLKMQSSDKPDSISFSVRFVSPYLRLPVEVDDSQIGQIDADSIFQPAAFRFFDWHTWQHIGGSIHWHNRRQHPFDGEEKHLISGFSYTTDRIDAYDEALGLRLAEGVEGWIRILSRDRILRVLFEPHYWIFEQNGSHYKPLAITNTRLAMLIISLSEIGGDNPAQFETGAKRLEGWVRYKLQIKNPERVLLELFRHIRDRGPLGMVSLFTGLGKVLERLCVPNTERILFDFYADNWGIRGNPHGRLVAVKTLQALATEKALMSLISIAHYIENRPLPAEEVEMIRLAIARITDQPQPQRPNPAGE